LTEAQNAAVVAVVCADKATRELCEQYRAAQIRLHETYEAIRVLGGILSDARIAAAWEASGLPAHARSWEA
jgi:hypothetical protein